MTTIDERITELESKVSFLELANQEMSDLIYAQQQQIDKHVRETTIRFESIRQDQDSGAAGDEKPPHY